jgi:enterochelin esterase-like enzyme
MTVQWKETPGGHNWSNWRDYLRDFAPLLFRSVQP